MESEASNQDAAPVVGPMGTEGPAAEETPAATSPAIPPTRISSVWLRVLPALVLLAIILLFVFQNLRDVRVRFATFTGTLPLAVALLAAGALGALVVLALGSIRILQLRKLVRHSPEGPRSPHRVRGGGSGSRRSGKNR